MFSAKLFKTDKTNQAGPKSFHHFKVNDSNILLIGETRAEMSEKLADKYTKKFNHFVADNENIKFFLESKSEDNIPLAKHYGFIDCIKQLDAADNLTIIHADKRTFNEEFFNVYLFLNKLAQLEQSVRADYLVRKVKPPKVIPFTNTSEFLAVVHQIADRYNKDFSLLNLFQFMKAQIAQVEQLIQQHEGNPCIAHFLEECNQELVEALELILTVEEEYSSISHLGDKARHDSLINVCIELMLAEGTFLPVLTFHNIYSLYLGNFLDATLVCDLWEALKENADNKSTYLLVFEEDHIARIAHFLKNNAEEIISVGPYKNGQIIVPELMEKLLMGSQSLRVIEKCALM